MTVYFIGAGPGHPDLLTLRAKHLIETCPVILYAGSLVPEAVLTFAGKDTKKINTAALNLEEIVREFEKAATEGHDVARLHSGDPSLYSAITEQMAHLKKLNIAYEIVPGVPAFAAAAALMGQELTVPEINQTLIITRTAKRATAVPEAQKLAQLAKSGATLALHLSAKNTADIEEELIPHYGADCPVVIAANVSWPEQKCVRTTLSALQEVIEAHKIERTAIIFVGQALGQMPKTTSALYSKTHHRHLKPAP